MLVEVGYQYVGTVRPRGKRKLVERDYFSTTTAEIEEIALDDAPVALWWEPPSLRDAGQIPLRAIDGALFEPAFRSLQEPHGASDIVPTCAPSSALRNPSEELGAEAVRRMLTTENIAMVFLDRPYSTRDKDRPPRIDEDRDIAKVESTTAESTVFKITERLKEMRLIDGVLYHQTDCPIIQVQSQSRGRLEMDHASAIHLERPGTPYIESTYSIDRYQDAIEYLNRDGMFDWHKRAPAPDIVDMSLTGFDETRFLVTMAAHKVVALLGQGQNGHTSYTIGAAALAMESREVFKLFVGLRDGLVNDASNEEIIGHLEAFCDSKNAQGIFHGVAKPIETLIRRLREADLHLVTARSP